MKHPTIPSILLILLISLITIISNSCKQEGCTDKAAINYSTIADKDDGTCMYCKTTITKCDTASIFLFDYNSGSMYYMQNVARGFLTTYHVKYNYPTCGTDSCQFFLTIQNLINKDIDCVTDIRLYSVVGFSVLTHLKIPANGTIDYGEFGSMASPTDCGIPGGEFHTYDLIFYH